MYSSTGTQLPRAGALIPRVAPGFGKRKNRLAKRKSRRAPSGKRIPMVHQKAFRETFSPSSGMNQKAIATMGTMNSRRLTVYPKGEGLDELAMAGEDTRTVCRVK